MLWKGGDPLTPGSPPEVSIMAKNAYELITAVRRMVGFPEPKRNADDPLSNGDILDRINVGYKHIVNVLNGVPAYVEFTVETDGTLAVTKSNSDPVIVTGDIVKNEYDFTYYKFPDIKAIGVLENLTDSAYKSDDRLMRNVSRYDRSKQGSFHESTDYFYYYDVDKRNGIAFFPKTLNKQNTIGLHYRQNVADLRSKIINDTVQYTQAVPGTGKDDMTISGNYTGTAMLDVRVIIDTVSPDNGKIYDTFKLSFDGGLTWFAPSIEITGIAQTYGTYNIYITFESTTGHVVGDYWDFSVWPNTSAHAFFDDTDMLGYPVCYAAYMTSKLTGFGDASDLLNDAMRELADFKRKYANTYFGPSKTLWRLLDHK